MIDVDVMDDAQSEAVLLALGPRLEWTGWYSPQTYWETQYVNRDDDYSRWYFIEKERESVFSCAYGTYTRNDASEVPNDTAPDNFTTLAAAKAACEHHYATGKWEGQMQ